MRQSDDFEMLAPIELSIFCFRYVPSQWKAALASANDVSRQRMKLELDDFNQRLLLALQRDGSSYLSNVSIGGRFGLRGCVMNYRTTLQDMQILIDDLRRVAATLRP